MKGVVCSGAVIHDTLVRPVEQPEWGTTTIVETLEPHVGGNAANTSKALAVLGVPVRTVASVGRDEQGRFVLESLAMAGVDTRAIRVVDAPTAATVALVNAAGNRKFLHRPGASVGLDLPIDFHPCLASGMRHYHLASLFILPNFRAHAAASLANARAAGLTTSLDTNWDPEGRWMDDLAPALPGLDFLFVNEDEARMLSGSSEPDATANMLQAHGARIVVIKLGPRGCKVFRAEGSTAFPAFATEVQDTTGAGDCFVAGFLAAHLRGSGLEEAARFANAVGALSVQRVGAAAGVRPYDETLRWMEARLAESSE